jgi:hypothetical protein
MSGKKTALALMAADGTMTVNQQEETNMNKIANVAGNLCEIAFFWTPVVSIFAVAMLNYL